MIRIEIKDDVVQAALNALIDAGSDLEPALRDIGEYLTKSTKERFIEGKAPDGTAWAPNTDLTLSRKKGDKPLIGESKRLSNELAYDLLGDGLEFGSSLEYAAVQQFGAKMGEFGRYSQVARYNKYDEKDFRRYAGTKKGFPLPWGDIPARPYLGISDDDRINIVAILMEHLTI